MVLEAAVNGQAAIVASQPSRLRQCAAPLRRVVAGAGGGMQEDGGMTTKTGTYPLRLPLSLKAESRSWRSGTARASISSSSSWWRKSYQR
jgi:hypothetical protein